MSSDRQRLQRRKRQKRKRRIAFFILLPIVFLTFTAAGYGAFLYKKAETIFTGSYMDDGRKKSDLRDAKVHPIKDNISILFIGIDESDVRTKEDKSRSDALMLATLNVKDKSIKLLSIPRDSYVYIPKVGYKTKINHAHAYGGPKATIDTVEELLDVPVDYYVRMNFYAFMDVVDALDGIKFNVPYKLSEKDSNDKHNAIQLEPGLQELNGEEALALARTRHYDSDIERGKRQQQLLRAVVKKATSFNSITKYDEILEAVGSNMTTNMTFGEMKALINYGKSGDIDFESLTLKGTDDKMSNGAYIYRLDDEELEVVKRKLARHLGLD
ncbi:LCP family protein [Pseudobacillus wudalianchiensis]|uniref:Transcriptional regulator n=1 Tax=Pseudobacillus wudalianchiensis TaxID=1743143 RepID=A0A1B9AYE8_9BACI|nr:LCP family protein [Bacillus wudalianchiensis]OCA88977.1 transcriptional regulator [Bacillus wudalianchiensis]